MSLGPCEAILQRATTEARRRAVGADWADQRRAAGHICGERPAFGMQIFLVKEQCYASGAETASGRNRNWRWWPEVFRQGRGGFVQVPGRIETTERILADIGRACEVMLAARVQARHPAPRERVRCRIGIEQVFAEERRAQLPGQAQRENPDRGEPHASMVVEPANLNQFFCPGVEACDPRAPVPCEPKAFMPGPRLPQGPLLGIKTDKHAWPCLEPSFPVAAPEHFLDELFSRREAVVFQDGGDHLFLGDQSPPDPGRKR